MRRGLLLLAMPLPIALAALACASKPPPKVCSPESAPAHDKGPVSIGMCTSDGPPPSSDAGAGDADGETPEPPSVDAGPGKSASLR